MNRKRLLMILIVIAASPTFAIAEHIDFYSKTDGGGKLVCQITMTAGRYLAWNFKKRSRCKDNKASSAVIVEAQRGTIFRIFDSGKGKSTDDWVDIRLLRNVQNMVISSFETNLINSSVSVQYHKKNGLNGKVSRAVIGPPLEDPCPPWTATIKFTGTGVLASGGPRTSQCIVDRAQKIRIRKHRKFWPDKTLNSEEKIDDKRLQVFYPCQARENVGTVFSEVIVGGKSVAKSPRISDVAFCG